MRRAPRILVWFWSPRGGGNSQYAVLLARRLSVSFGRNAVTLSMHGDDPSQEMARGLGLSVLSAPIVSDRKRILATAGGLLGSSHVIATHVRESDADLVCIAMNFATAAPLSLAIHKPLIYFAHDPAPHPGDFAAVGQRFTQSLLLRRAEAIVALSAHSAGELKSLDRAVGAKLHVAPLGAAYEPQSSSRAPHPRPVRLLFLGRMMAYKGLDILADALVLLHDRTDWRLTIAGEGPSLDAAMRARFNDPRIEVRAAPLRYDELDPLFASHDVLVAPYRSATQSGVVAQASSWSMPSVVTPVGALVEQIGAGRLGWAASAVTAEAFAAALVAMLDDDVARAGKADAAHAQSIAAWEGVSWDWLAALAH